MSKQRISTWLKEVIKDCYQLKGLGQPDHVKGHDVRKQATSWADLAGVDPEKICQAATWQSTNKLSSMFARHYRLDLLAECPSDFGRQVLKSAASSTAERSVKRSLGSSSRDPHQKNRRGGDTYRIPRLSERPSAKVSSRGQD